MRVLFLPESTSASVAILTRYPAGTLVRFTTVLLKRSPFTLWSLTPRSGFWHYLPNYSHARTPCMTFGMYCIIAKCIHGLIFHDPFRLDIITANYALYSLPYVFAELTYSISQEICTRFCCALLCCGYAIVHNEFTWSIYPYSSGLLCWHWGNR